MPTFELDLGALELEFDNQLEAAIDNLFDEFASLRDLEPIATSTAPLTDTKIAKGNETKLGANVSYSVAPTATSNSSNNK
jgi:hypothetical protein